MNIVSLRRTNVGEMKKKFSGVCLYCIVKNKASSENQRSDGIGKY